VIVVPRTWVPGVPRGWGNRKTEDQWLDAIEATLSHHANAVAVDAARAQYAVTLEFRINPRSKEYNGQHAHDGTDLDNLIKMTIDGLCATKRRGLNILPNDRLIYQISAEKTLVETDDEMGAFITLESL
jgi:hypothetical protein